MAEEKKPEKKTLTLKITVPTVEDVKEALKKLFPGIQITVEGEAPGETLTIPDDEKATQV